MPESARGLFHGSGLRRRISPALHRALQKKSELPEIRRHALVATLSVNCGKARHV
jgi:hypothetical protein